MTDRRFHILIAIFLLFCLLCPFVETALHSNDSIFQSGDDTESTVAILLLVLELAFALANLFILVLRPVHEGACTLDLRQPLRAWPRPVVPLHDIFPPLPLRI
jgi:hypothetical protein